jgi:hypothetical protein
MVISDLNHLEDTNAQVIGGLSVYVTGNEPVELEVPVPIYGEPVRQKDGSTRISLIGWKTVKSVFYPTNTEA